MLLVFLKSNTFFRFYEADANLAEPGAPIVRLCNDPGHRI